MVAVKSPNAELLPRVVELKALETETVSPSESVMAKEPVSVNVAVFSLAWLLTNSVTEPVTSAELMIGALFGGGAARVMTRMKSPVPLPSLFFAANFSVLLSVVQT